MSTTLNNNAVHTQRVITLKLVDAQYDDDELIKEGGNVFTQVYLNLTLLPFTDKHRAALRDIGRVSTKRTWTGIRMNQRSTKSQPL